MCQSYALLEVGVYVYVCIWIVFQRVSNLLQFGYSFTQDDRPLNNITAHQTKYTFLKSD